MEQDYARLATAIRDARDARGWSQSELAKQGGPSTTTTSKLERGELQPIPGQTRRKIETSLGWEDGSVDAVLRGGDPTPTVSTGNVLTVATREADEAQAAFERAVGELAAAEARVDAANRLVFRLLALEAKILDEKDRREALLGRQLSSLEYATIDGVDRPTEAEIAELIATHALHSPHEWTRYEMALVEAFAQDYPADVTEGSGYADLEPARSKVARLVRPVVDFMHPPPDPEITAPAVRYLDRIVASAHSEDGEPIAARDTDVHGRPIRSRGRADRRRQDDDATAPDNEGPEHGA